MWFVKYRLLPIILVVIAITSVSVLIWLDQDQSAEQQYWFDVTQAVGTSVAQTLGGTATVEARPRLVLHNTIEGETLAMLSRTYNVTADLLRAANGLTSDEIAPGTELVIPANMSALEPARSFAVYRAAEDETPEQIAETFSLALEDLLRDNPTLTEQQHLSEGDVIFVPIFEETDTP